MSSSDNIQSLSNKGYEYSFTVGTSPLVIPSYPENNSSTSYKVALFAAAFLLAGGLALGGTSVFFYLNP